MKWFWFLREPTQAHASLQEAWIALKPYILAGHRFELTIETERRSSEASAKFHAICGDLERARLPWAGKPRTSIEWKVLLISGHSVATKQGAEMVPGLENEFVNIRESSARMSTARMSSLIEYSLAFCAAHGVETADAIA